MESKKRERSSNFNASEVQLLVSLVEKYKYIIENKKTDAVTNKDKECAWKKIESAFNSCGVSTNNRSWKTLKLKYEGIKKNTKKKSSLQRQEMYKTGGGPSNAPDFTNVEEKILSICSNITGLDARYDSDTIILPLSKDDPQFTEIPTVVNCVTEDTDEQDRVENTSQNIIKVPDLNESILGINEDEEEQYGKENKWDKWHPKLLKARVSNVLRSDMATKGSVTAKLDKLSSARLELVQFQLEAARKANEFMEEEHKLKMMHLVNDEKRKQEMHELVMDKIRRAPLNVNSTM